MIMTCIDRRECFARGCRGGCTILTKTYPESGQCPFCKPDPYVTDGVRYKYNKQKENNDG